jgi:putative heme degradation protein
MQNLGRVTWPLNWVFARPNWLQLLPVKPRPASHPDQVMAAVQTLGPIMALTRNESCVHEVTGIYQGYHSGAHACMVLVPTIIDA